MNTNEVNDNKTESVTDETKTDSTVDARAENTVNTKTESTVDTGAKSAEEEKRKKSEDRLEILVAIFLGITAILMAWATWIGALHGGNQATNYTKSNNLAAEGNAEYNVAAQLLISDMMTWNSLMEYQLDMSIAIMNGNDEEAELIEQKVEKLMTDNCSEQMVDAINWALEQGEDASPFQMEGFLESYFADANALLAESQELLLQGQEDNANGDKYGLVTVIFSVVLFLLGIVGIFKRLPNRRLIFAISVVLLVIGVIYMFMIPLPTEFSFANYF